MNNFLNNLKEKTNFTYTENGSITHRSTLNMVYDLFALGGSYRSRVDDDCAFLFKKAYDENPALALKCLFYLRDIRGGQGERRFFRVCLKWLVKENPNLVIKNLKNIPEYGRWDDLFVLLGMGNKVNTAVMELIKEQLALDLESYQSSPTAGVSLLAKWLPSENASAKETKKNATTIRKYLGMSSRDYRKMLSTLRSRLNLVETMMSQGKWEEIQFDKIPSKAGILYKNAFAKHDYDRYKEFMENRQTKVNTKTLYPYDIAHMAFNIPWRVFGENYDVYSTDRLAIQKYWDNLIDIYEGKEENGLCIVDTSGSMCGRPLETAIGLGAYIAERGHGPFANHFITFSSQPELVKFDGIDIVDKFQRAENANWNQNTDLKAVFDLLLRTAKINNASAEDMPTRLYILSDMEFDGCLMTPYSIKGSSFDWGCRCNTTEDNVNTLLENIAIEWKEEGYELPEVVFWNLDARSDRIAALTGGRFSYVSGSSPIIIQQILQNKTGINIMLSKLLESGRYDAIITE